MRSVGPVSSMQVELAAAEVTLADIVCGGFVRLEIAGYRYDSETFDLIGD